MSAAQSDTSADRNSGDSASAAAPRDRKSGLSCAECRRSKLKCDRVFPCQSCIRRGCAAICPDGTLAATKGNKVLMAHAQSLSEQVKSMSSRIKELELALAESQSSRLLHPLLQPSSDSSSSKETSQHESPGDPDLDDLSEVIGSLSIGNDGKSKYHGETAGVEYLRSLIPDPVSTRPRRRHPKYLGLPANFIDLVHAFPFGISDCPNLLSSFATFVPPLERTNDLIDHWYFNMAWLFDIVPRAEFKTDILDHIYRPDGTISLTNIHSHRLCIFFLQLAGGVFWDAHPSAGILSEQYHALACAAFSVTSIVKEASIATVQALHMHSIFAYVTDRTRNEERWLMNGLTAKLVQTIGLQRDSAKWGLSPDDVERRRHVFWDYFTWETWVSLVNGRPPALILEHTDCRFPQDREPFFTPSGETHVGWHSFKHRFAAECLAGVSHRTFLVQRPSYAYLLDLHRRIRTFPIPIELQSPIEGSDPGAAWSSDPRLAMQQCSLMCQREPLLIYTHRSYLAQALRDSPEDPLSHKYGPSVMAAYEAARHVLQGLKQVYALHPKHISRIWFFWTGAFSACVIMGVIVTRSPGCSIAQRALSELDELCNLFEEGSTPCRPAGTVAVLNKLQRRAYTTFVDFHANPDFARSNKLREDELSRCDEFEVMGGTQQIIKEEPAAATVPPEDHTPIPEDHTPIPFAARGDERGLSSLAGFGGAFTPSPFGEPSVVGSAAFMDHFGTIPGRRPSQDPGAPSFVPSSIGSQRPAAMSPPDADRRLLVEPADLTQYSAPVNYVTAPSLFPGAPMYASSFSAQSIGMQSDQPMSMDTGYPSLTPLNFSSAPNDHARDDMWWSLVQDLGLNHS